jgi:hypothetical protein
MALFRLYSIIRGTFDYENYPNDAADMAGYWAEARIIGGVVLFDRRPDGNPDHVYLLPNHEDVTYRI